MFVRDRKTLQWFSERRAVFSPRSTCLEEKCPESNSSGRVFNNAMLDFRKGGGVLARWHHLPVGHRTIFCNSGTHLCLCFDGSNRDKPDAVSHCRDVLFYMTERVLAR